MAETSKSTKAAADDAGTKAAPAGVGDGGASQLQATMDEAEAKGYLGEVADETPNRNYTVAGVLEGAETPETAEREGR